jgi:hypothetical protein
MGPRVSDDVVDTGVAGASAVAGLAGRMNSTVVANRTESPAQIHHTAWKETSVAAALRQR